jgi:hypothetical protein
VNPGPVLLGRIRTFPENDYPHTLLSVNETKNGQNNLDLFQTFWDYSSKWQKTGIRFPKNATKIQRQSGHKRKIHKWAAFCFLIIAV